MLHVLVDSNVFVSGLLRSKNCREILDRFRAGTFVLVTADPLLDKLIAVLRRTKFARVVTEGTRNALIDRIRREARFVTPRPSSIPIRDPKDRPALECLYAADCLVTGDSDLQVLKRPDILSPRAFLARLAAES